jgi:meiotically up-regulated gene 157 (Mug157) protein
MEKLIEKMKGKIKDPDLFRLFENRYPNTLDTMIKWRGFAEKLDSIPGNETTTDEELTYVIASDVWTLPPHRFGGAKLMDGANVLSLLAMPL